MRTLATARLGIDSATSRPRDGLARELAVARLYQDHATFLLGVTRRLVGSSQDAEDIVQEVFITAHKKCGELIDHPNVRGWLYRTAYHRAQHTWRSRKRRNSFTEKWKGEKSPDVATPEDAAVSNETLDIVTRCVQRLAPQYREVFVLFELEELSGPEVAALLDIPVNTVWSRLHRAREQFKKIWKERSND